MFSTSRNNSLSVYLFFFYNCSAFCWQINVLQRGRKVMQREVGKIEDEGGGSRNIAKSWVGRIGCITLPFERGAWYIIHWAIGKRALSLHSISMPICSTVGLKRPAPPLLFCLLLLTASESGSDTKVLLLALHEINFIIHQKYWRIFWKINVKKPKSTCIILIFWDFSVTEIVQILLTFSTTSFTCTDSCYSNWRMPSY